MIIIKQSGSFDNTERILKKIQNAKYLSLLDMYGEEGVLALSNATPTDSGKTASSWSYEVTVWTRGKTAGATIAFKNSNVVDGAPVAILIQYGHGTKNGGYVQGIDYINPTLEPIFNRLADAVWKEVTR